MFVKHSRHLKVYKIYLKALSNSKHLTLDFLVRFVRSKFCQSPNSHTLTRDRLSRIDTIKWKVPEILIKDSQTIWLQVLIQCLHKMVRGNDIYYQGLVSKTFQELGKMNKFKGIQTNKQSKWNCFTNSTGSVI